MHHRHGEVEENYRTAALGENEKGRVSGVVISIDGLRHRREGVLLLQPVEAVFGIHHVLGEVRDQSNRLYHADAEDWVTWNELPFPFQNHRRGEVGLTVNASRLVYQPDEVETWNENHCVRDDGAV